MAKKTRRQFHTDADAARYGFRWGQLDVVRNCEFGKTKSVSVITDSHELSVAVSPLGRSVRVWLDDELLVDPAPYNEEITRLRAELQKAKKHDEDRGTSQSATS